MNKTYNILLLLFLTFMTSCSDFLDVDPYDRPATEIALGNIDGLDQALNGTYKTLLTERYYGKLFISISEYMGEDMRQKEDNGTYDTYGDVYRYTKSIETEEIDRLWEYCYDVLLRANNILVAIPDCIDGTEEEKNGVEAEALFIRALAHFDLVRAFAQNYTYTDDASHVGIPILTRPLNVTEKPSRNSVKEVYDQIIIDLKSSIELFELAGSSFDPEYANKYAAQALLSRVYLYMGNTVLDDGKTGWENCILYASEVIENSPLTLVSENNYVNSFATLVPSSEAIFELAVTSASTFNIGAFLTPGTEEERAEAIPTLDLMQLYTPTDIRVNMFKISSQSGLVYSKKYPGADGQVGLDNVKILRLSEVYLNRAEAYANMNDDTSAAADLDVIKKRADSSIEASTLTGDDLLEEIYNERRRELAFEGHRIWDITRRHQSLHRIDCNPLFSKQDVEYPNYQFILPIPEDEITVNENIEQNDNY